MNFKELQQKIKELEDGFNIKDIECGLLESELTETLKPNILLSELTFIHLEMLKEVHEYSKGKSSDRITSSKNRLLNLLDISTQLSGIGDKNKSLKLFNRELVTRIQLLRIENSDLRKELKKIEDAASF